MDTDKEILLLTIEDGNKEAYVDYAIARLEQKNRTRGLLMGYMLYLACLLLVGSIISLFINSAVTLIGSALIIAIVSIHNALYWKNQKTREDIAKLQEYKIDLVLKNPKRL